MRIFLVLSAGPDPDGEAVEVVAYEVARQASQLGHTVIIQVILREPRGSANSVRAERALERFRIDNTVVSPPLYVTDVAGRGSQTRPGPIGRCLKIANSFKVEEMFPASRLGPQVEARVQESRADAILSVWSWEALAATSRIRHVPKLVYYGNPDHLPTEARLRNPELFGFPRMTLRDRLALTLDRVRNRRRRSLHTKMMNRCEVTANNSILDARFYAEHGHPRSIYLQNMWPDIPDEADDGKAVASGAIRIIGSVGNLGATGNTFGLYYLGKELMPRLRARLAGRPFEVHVVGTGSPALSVARYLDDPRIIRRGWVDDINQEIRSSHAFLVLTNVSDDFLVGNTRILLAWALRACVILHANSGLAMPEIEHGRNALLGRTPDEIVDLIVQAMDDDGLRRKIGAGGYETFQAYYRSDVVVPKMLAVLEEMVRP